MRPNWKPSGKRTARLAAVNQELEAFGYSVSHDLRTPLRSMDGFGQALLDDYAACLDETGQDYCVAFARPANGWGN